MSLEKLKHNFYLFITPTILIVVACVQLYNAHFKTLSPWKGGGFGMFSTIDKPENRFLRAYFVTGQGEHPIEIPDSFEIRRLTTEIKSIPAKHRLLRLARKLANASNLPKEVDTFNAVRVEVWRIKLEAQTGQLNAHKLMEATLK